MRSVNICITVTAVALTLAVAGCTRGKESASASRVPTSTAAGSPTPTVPSPPSGSPVSPTASTPPGAGKPAPATAPVADRWVMSADGIGPYRIGVRVDEMPAGLFGPSTPVDSVNCPGLYSVQATGEYEGTLALTVRHNYLVGIGTAGGKPVHSAAGATVGTSFERVQEIYGTRGKMDKDSTGKPGFIVPAGDRVMLFGGHPIREGVGWFEVGLADHTEHMFRTGKHC
jgi:hypothetical protein